MRERLAVAKNQIAIFAFNSDMPISKSQDVFHLIKSLTKAEKRSFRLYAKTNKEGDGLLFLKLFDIMDKSKDVDEAAIKKKMGNISTTKYANLKRHLFSKILSSLRLLHRSKKTYVRIREYVDFALLLYDKGLYMQSLKLLDNARKLALKDGNDFSVTNIFEIEKMILSRYITRSKTDDIYDIVDASYTALDRVVNRVDLSNLRMLLHRYYINHGHVKNDKEAEELKGFFADRLPELKESKLGRMEKAYLYQSYVWYYYILHDWKKCRSYAQKWVELFRSDKEMQSRDANLFLRGYNYLLNANYFLGDTSAFEKVYKELQHFRKSKYHTFNHNNKVLSFLYAHNGRLNGHFLRGSFRKGVEDVPRTLNRLKRYEEFLDDHKVMILHYKIAWMYLGNGQAETAVSYLQTIINMTNRSLRMDIQAYARIMFLMVHYELGNMELLPRLIKQYKHFIQSNDLNSNAKKVLLDLFHKLHNAPLMERKKLFQKHLKDLREIEKSVYERRDFVYLDAVVWMRSKIENKSMEVIAKSR